MWAPQAGSEGQRECLLLTAEAAARKLSVLQRQGLESLIMTSHRCPEPVCREILVETLTRLTEHQTLFGIISQQLPH